MSRKEQIIEVAMRHFSLNGFAGTSTQTIADECKISQANVFYHFKNKKKLFEEALHFGINKNREIYQNLLKPSDYARERLYLVVYSNFIWAKDYPEYCHMFLMLFNFAPTDESFKELCTHFIERGVSRVKGAIEETNSEEKLGLSESEISIAAETLQRLTTSILFQLLSRSNPEAIFKEVESTYKSIIDKIISKSS